jgi:hypothetical protein
MSPEAAREIFAQVEAGTLDEAGAIKALEFLGYDHGSAVEFVAVAAGWSGVEEVE